MNDTYASDFLVAHTERTPEGTIARAWMNAVDGGTGDTRWRHQFLPTDTYFSATFRPRDDIAILLQPSAIPSLNNLVAIDLASGKVRWTYPDLADELPRTVVGKTVVIFTSDEVIGIDASLGTKSWSIQHESITPRRTIISHSDEAIVLQTGTDSGFDVWAINEDGEMWRNSVLTPGAAINSESIYGGNGGSIHDGVAVHRTASGLVGLHLANGEQAWSRSLWSHPGPTSWDAEVVAPTTTGEIVVAQRMNDGLFVQVLDFVSGTELWSRVIDDAADGSGNAAFVGTTEDAVLFSSTGAPMTQVALIAPPWRDVTSFAVADGTELWTYQASEDTIVDQLFTLKGFGRGGQQESKTLLDTGDDQWTLIDTATGNTQVFDAQVGAPMLRDGRLIVQRTESDVTEFRDQGGRLVAVADGSDHLYVAVGDELLLIPSAHGLSAYELPADS